MENQGQIQDLLNVLRMRRWQILLPAVFLLSIGIAIATVVPKKFLVVTRIELRESNLGEESATERELYGAEYHIKHHGRTREVIESQIDLWPEYFELSSRERGEFVADVLDDVEVITLSKTKDRGSAFVDIAYKDVDPDRAEAFLSDLTKIWIKEVIERDINAVTAELEILRNELSEATKDLGEKKSQFHTLANELGFDPTQPVDAKFQNRGDHVSRRLEQNIESREEARLDLFTLLAALDSFQEQLASTPRLIETTVEDQTTSFDVELLNMQRQLAELEVDQSRFTKRNSNYNKIQRQINEMRRSIQDVETLRDQAKALKLQAANPEYGRLELLISDHQTQVRKKRAAIEELDQKIATLQTEQIARGKEFETLTRLEDEAELIRSEVRTKNAQMTEKEIQLRVMREAYGQPFDIAQEPEASETPTEPNPALIIAVFLLIGLILGLGSAVIAEFATNGFRSVHDLRGVMNVPVLGSVNVIVTRAEARKARARRTVVGLSSAIVMFCILWLTWTWSTDPDRLPLGVVESIEGFRKMLS